MLVCFLNALPFTWIQRASSGCFWWREQLKRNKLPLTSLKTISMNINHVEYKQDFKNDLYRKVSKISTAVVCWNSENGFWLSCIEYFNLLIEKYGWRYIKVACCENHSNIYICYSPALVGPYWEKLYSRQRAQFFPIRTDQGRWITLLFISKF